MHPGMLAVYYSVNSPPGIAYSTINVVGSMSECDSVDSQLNYIRVHSVTLASLFPRRLCDAHSFVLCKQMSDTNSQVTTMLDKREKAEE